MIERERECDSLLSPPLFARSLLASLSLPPTHSFVPLPD